MRPLVVTSVGMASSLGLDSACACAAARAGLVRLREINTFNYALEPDLSPEGLDGPELLAAHMLPVSGAGTTGLAKLLALARPALKELLSETRVRSADWARTAFLVNVSDGYFQTQFGVPGENAPEDDPGYAVRWERIARELPHRLCKEFELPIEGRRRFILLGGHAGIADLLSYAGRLLEANEIDRCIVGAIESCLDPQAILAYARAAVLKCGTNPAGFIPGEAAAFLLVERADRVTHDHCALVISAISKSSDVAYFREESPPEGRALARCLCEVLSLTRTLGSPEVLIADLNGTECRAVDWGGALVQVRAEWADFGFESWLPARSFGETGAATGGVAVCQLFCAADRGYAPPGGALIALCSEDGARSVMHFRSLN